MKHDITETRLFQIISKYLDCQNLSIIEKHNNIYLAENKDDKYGVIRYDTKYRFLVISDNLINEVSNMFGLSEKETSHVISLWVENVLSMTVIKTFEWDSVSQYQFCIPE